MKQMSRGWIKVFVAISGTAAFVTIFGSAFADAPPIPSEAYVACEAKSAGDPCSVQFRELKLEGTCTKSPSGDQLFCRPNNLPLSTPEPSDGH